MNEPEKQQEPVAWVAGRKERVGFGREETRKFVVFDQTLPVGTEFYTAPPTAAIAASRMRDAAVKVCRDEADSIDKAEVFLSRSHCLRIVAEAIASLPVPEVQWRDLTDDEILEASEDSGDLEVNSWRIEYCRAVIAKFKEKNK